MSAKQIQNIYKEVQNILFNLVPEKWDSIYLYASVIKGRGEMYFYYFPKRTILKTKPINCYEVARKFGIDEEQYNILLNKLYEKIRELNNLSVRKWTNITISIANCLFTVEYNFNDLTHSLYTDEQRHIYWEYKYLHKPMESMNKKEQNLIRYYQEEGEKPITYTEGIYINEEALKAQNEPIRKPMEKFQKPNTFETNLQNNTIGFKIRKNKKMYDEDDLNPNLEVRNPILKY